jgi:predicted transcriptional regulator
MTTRNPSPERTSLHDRLIAWGLSKSEADVYLYLLQKPTESGGSKISLGTELHRQYVYLALEKLIELGLVETVNYGKRKRYKARPPHEIEKITRRRSLDASDLVYELEKISAVHNDQDFEVLQGTRAIQQYEMDYAEQVAAGESEYIIGGNANGFEQVMGDLLDEYIEIKDGKKIAVHYLGGDSVEIERYRTQQFFQARLLPGLPQKVTHMVIRNDEVLFFSFLTPPLVYVLKSKAVVEDYTQFFLLLWNLAKPAEKP